MIGCVPGVRMEKDEEEDDEEWHGFVFITMWVREWPLGFTSHNTEECTVSSGSVQRCSLLDVPRASTEHTFAQIFILRL